MAYGLGDNGEALGRLQSLCFGRVMDSLTNSKSGPSARGHFRFRSDCYTYGSRVRYDSKSSKSITISMSVMGPPLYCWLKTPMSKKSTTR